MGDPLNTSILSGLAFNGDLYLGTLNVKDTGGALTGGWYLPLRWLILDIHRCGWAGYAHELCVYQPGRVRWKYLCWHGSG